MKTLLILLATVGTTLGKYVPPTENVPIFRRDTLLLDSYQQELLAQDLYRLATRSTALSTPKHRRATAQLLALVTTITPQSKGPANLNRSFASDEVDSSLLIGSQFESVFENVSKITRHLLESEAVSYTHLRAHETKANLRNGTVPSLHSPHSKNFLPPQRSQTPKPRRLAKKTQKTSPLNNLKIPLKSPNHPSKWATMQDPYPFLP